MKITHIFLSLIFFIAGCSSDSNLSRLDSEYFPQPDSGSCWSYASTDTLNTNFQIFVQNNDFYYEGRYSSNWIWNGENIYFWKDKGNLEIFHRRDKYFNGTLYEIEKRWTILIKFPLIEGDIWEEYFSNNINILGDIFSINIKTSLNVYFIDDLTTPAGSFTQCYKILIKRNIEEKSQLLGDNNYSESFGYWLAPGIGIIKYEDSTGTYLLTDYTFK